jgi:hypothetical protein
MATSGASFSKRACQASLPLRLKANFLCGKPEKSPHFLCRWHFHCWCVSVFVCISQMLNVCPLSPICSASQTGMIFMEDVKIPESNMLPHIQGLGGPFRCVVREAIV